MAKVAKKNRTMMMGVTPEQYAADHSCSVDAVLQAVAANQLVVNLDGSIDPKSPRIGLTQAQFGKRLNVSRQAVNKAAAADRLVYHIDGSIDANASRESWGESAHSDSDPEPESSADLVGKVTTFKTERARREAAEARLAELKLAEKEGKLLNASETHDKIFDIFQTIRESLLDLPDLLSGPLTGKDSTSEIRSILDEAIREKLNAAADAVERIGE